ncbi:M48 family metallopeptidase [Bradyrhizobium sp. LHD-71]|uniref:M48 family metallopeptidase n=1 Tax=Bradyrhizobium sp. LHD-71 TaxID=3072141 RepID=UPI00280FB0AC|nr:M48 family metallopeptidase [Bradyrhizobium sp. LHD-71]MDQ8732391.1 M48 family metallopeptidase [Bradyrhizobium sp. LHD-71]
MTDPANSTQADASIEAVPPARAPVTYLDGTSSRRRNVMLRLADRCEILQDDAVVASWPYADIRRADGPSGILRAMCVSAPVLARLEIRDATLAAELERRCPSLDADLPGAKGVMSIVGWSVAALVSIVLMVLFVVPFAADRLTPLIPYSIEKRIGEVADKQVNVVFDGKTCASPDGTAAFAKLMDTLRRAGGVDVTADAAVISNDIANAVALPGGKIYVFEGLLAKAESVDELAGVLAHELGHVKNRDGLRNLIYNGGTSFLIGLLFGDITGSSAIIFTSRELFQASHSREAERNADTTTIEVMRKLGRSPKPMGEFLLRVTGKEKGKGLALISSHPLSEDRLVRMSEQDISPSAPPLLTAAEWAALKSICKTPDKS